MTNLELEAFLSVIQNGSLSKAAIELYITQPALSRRIKNLENELGYELFKRGKGKKEVELTSQGELFLPLARKYLSLLKEAKQIKNNDQKETFLLASIGSVSTYLLPSILQTFLKQNDYIKLCFHIYHSFEVYKYVEEKQIDLAIVSHQMYYKNIQTIPLFSEEMVLVSNKQYTNPVHPSELDVSHEIRIPWSPEYDIWHDYWFQSSTDYAVNLDEMSLLEYFLSLENTWAIVPISIAKKLHSIHINHLIDGPEKRVIYYIKRLNSQNKIIDLFVEHLQNQLKELDYIEVF
nr:LysR family transcriptional regulator [uncultured Faecalibacillus sp.]